MTGNASIGRAPAHGDDRLPLRQYLAVDGGVGARLFAALPTATPALQPVSSPRHADLLLIAGPISTRLAPAVAELARALPAPAQTLLLAPGASDSDALRRLFPDAPIVTMEPGDETGNVVRLVAAIRALGPPTGALALGDLPAYESPLIPMPAADAHELATELNAFSLGPLQPFTAGPLRLWLICDGEQVLECRVDAGYAARDLATRMAATGWRAAADLAAWLDPLAPVAGRLAFVRALEALQGWRAPALVEQSREAALALERAMNHLTWASRFFRLLAAPRLAEQATDLAWRVSALVGSGEASAACAAIVPQGPASSPQTTTAAILPMLASQVDRLARWVKRDRLLWLRTRGVGALPPAWVAEAGVDGPNATTPARGANDCHARLLARLTQAASDLRLPTEPFASFKEPGLFEFRISGTVGVAPVPPNASGQWMIPSGEAEGASLGPRGRLAVRLTSAGGAGPARVEWAARPSARALALLPRLLAGQIVADAEIIVASLDLSMAEADG